MSGKTLFEKVWDTHVVAQDEGAPAVLYIDAHLIHEVTSPQAFSMLRERDLKVRRPDRTFATMDHAIPTRIGVDIELWPSDAATQVRMNEQFALAFAEDKAILEAIQVEETKLGGRQRPLRLGIDKGAVMMRKTVERMIEAERSDMAAE